MSNHLTAFNHTNVRTWMKYNAKHHKEAKTGETNYTTLVEECCTHFDVDNEGGPLDDEQHWVWDLALEF